MYASCVCILATTCWEFVLLSCFLEMWPSSFRKPSFEHLFLSLPSLQQPLPRVPISSWCRQHYLLLNCQTRLIICGLCNWHCIRSHKKMTQSLPMGNSGFGSLCPTSRPGDRGTSEEIRPVPFTPVLLLSLPSFNTNSSQAALLFSQTMGTRS